MWKTVGEKEVRFEWTRFNHDTTISPPVLIFGQILASPCRKRHEQLPEYWSQCLPVTGACPGPDIINVINHRVVITTEWSFSPHLPEFPRPRYPARLFVTNTIENAFISRVSNADGYFCL